MKLPDSLRQRARAALQTAFVGDALAMPVHWYYRPSDILRQFPGGIQKFEAAPKKHPSSIMSLHSTRQGGRQTVESGSQQKEIVGDVILKGRRQFWGQPNIHYHHGMQAGENTLNAQCARVLMRRLATDGGQYDARHFLADYIDFMTADPPQHRDTYAESYHRGFFANLEAGHPPGQCGAVTHDTASIGALVTLAPLVFAALNRGSELESAQALCQEHAGLTHPDRSVFATASSYAQLLTTLLHADGIESARSAIAEQARADLGLDLPRLLKKWPSDLDVIGGLYSPACYLSGSWPGVLYLAYRYLDDPTAGLLANANVGGDNVHRGFVLGTLLGLVNDAAAQSLFGELVESATLMREFHALLDGNS